MQIETEDLEFCAKEFGVTGRIKEWKILSNGPGHPVPPDVIRLIVYAAFEGIDGGYVIKFIREPLFSTSIIERQSAFSDLLREHGIVTPARMQKDGNYCIPFVKSGLLMNVTMEEWIGLGVSHMTSELMCKMGAVLGKAHQISLCYRPYIGYARLYEEVMLKDTSWQRLWTGASYDFIPKADLRNILEAYAARISAVKQAWPELPRAAVHDDLYSCNNYVFRNGEIALYDFNLAGDEVLIGDILLTWFRTIYDEEIQEDLKSLNLHQIWVDFIQAYQLERPLSVQETEHFIDAYALLGALYATKLMAYYVHNGQMEVAKKQYHSILELLQAETVPL